MNRLSKPILGKQSNRGLQRMNPQQPPTFVMTIKFTPGVGVELQAPVHDKFLCYGMLKMAEKVIDSHVPGSEHQQPRPDALPISGFESNSSIEIPSTAEQKLLVP